MSSCHILTAVGTFVIAITSLYWMKADEDWRISATIGLGFGQLSLLAIWCVAGVSRVRYWSSAFAVLGCYLAMSIWVAIQGQHVDGVFFLSLAISCVIYFFAMAAAMVVVRKLRGISLVRLTDLRVTEDFSGQFGIRDIMIAMSIAAIATALIKYFSTLDYAGHLLNMLGIFGLVAVSFFLLSWPVVLACLSERWLLLAVFSAILIVVILLIQRPIFSSILGPIGDLGFFVFLDIPFAIAVAIHAMIARWFGYRLTTSGKA